MKKCEKHTQVPNDTISIPMFQRFCLVMWIQRSFQTVQAAVERFGQPIRIPISEASITLVIEPLSSTVLSRTIPRNFYNFYNVKFDPLSISSILKLTSKHNMC